ncbi:leucyl/phenylalanyl-tRNA--protein transferase [Nocardioides daphniae]|uniref:Leucyl/phenylalanyl-tRNA--protein transferase n=1 Tax=Nocardioides daphniae TaxID=402297 RepID=A0A4P7U811_9ACTN|nr:leucyl/phenylalanyl-tRNA--protein transferase [Nocardioides daphniae]QCC76126.1 leucyl/phenylalanyl-tRNA--protein transferase [Nocardioides daphniae]
MPFEPPPSTWSLTEVTATWRASTPPTTSSRWGRPDAGTLLQAYRCGLFPMPSGEPGDPPMWFLPVRRGVLPLDHLKVSRSLRRSARTMEIRVNTAFSEVVAACGDPRRPHAWIDADIVDAYTELHEMGWAHSVEAWRDGELVGGLYGVAINGLFAGESMFHRATDASKVALMGLVDLMRDRYADTRLLDVQWSTDHLASLGVVEVSRETYAVRLAAALRLPLPAAFDDGEPSGPTLRLVVS